MNMKDRIKLIREGADEKKKLSQQEFANSLGLSRNMIAQVEMGTRILSDRSIRDICRIYKVNEEWLRTGNGEMKQPRSDNEIIAKFVNDVLEAKSEDIRKRLKNALSQLDEREWKVLEEIAKKMQ